MAIKACVWCLITLAVGFPSTDSSSGSRRRRTLAGRYLHVVSSATKRPASYLIGKMSEPQRRVMTIMALNNRGLRLLRQGNSRQAIPALLESLHHLKESAKKRPLSATTNAVDQDSCIHQERQSLFCPVPITPSSTTCTATSDCEPCSSSASHLGRDLNGLPFQMFDQVFAFDASDLKEHDDDDISSPNNRDGSSAAILYNLAATHHSQALDLMRSSKSARISLTKAVQLYTYALGAVQQWARHFEVHEGCHVLRLATLNNLAHANALLQHRDAAQHCLTCLKDILSQAKGRVATNEYAFFSANVVVLCLKDGTGNLVVAPAAAA